MKALLKTPWFLLAIIAVLLAVLYYRYTQGDKPQPPLSKKEERATRERVAEHTRKAARDSIRSQAAYQAATAHYQAGSQAAQVARTLRQQSHAHRPSSDTTAASLQRFFSAY